SIAVGLASDVEVKAPVTITSSCDQNGSGDHDIGTFVVAPSSGSSDGFAIRIVSGVGKAVADCSPADNYSGCIVARRELSFVPHTPLTLPIAMRLDCLDVPCIPGESCVLGVCKSATIISPASCEGSGCAEQTLSSVDGGPPDAGSPTDGAAETAGGHGPTSDGALPDATPADAATPDAIEAGGMSVDASGGDAPSADVGADGPAADASSEEASIDATIDAPMDAADASVSPDSSSSDAGTGQDGTSPSDAGVLGSCVSPGTSSGVSCGGGTCASGDVCCVGPAAGPVTEMCTAPGTCAADPGYSSYACLNAGDCAPGTVCCVAPLPSVGYESTCAASCPTSFTRKIACRNSCECSTLTCVETTCAGKPMGTCSGLCP
ncbi:MAG: hypothetical protein ACREJ3_07815, partial [Polyangiaceae bacterium]